MMEWLRRMFFGRKPPEVTGDSRVDEIAEQKVASDAAIARVDKLSTGDYALRRAVRGTAKGVRAIRRTGG